MQKTKDNSLPAGYCIIFVILSALLFWKCRYGYANLDEAFYLTIPYRFIQGDIILYEEWSNTQLSAFIIMPILWFYIKIVGSTQGIYLFIRYVYTVLKCLMTIFIFVKLKRFNKIAAMITSVSFLVFASYGLMVLSYNSMAIGGLLCTLLLLMTDRQHKLAKLSYFAAGIFLSVAVLALPYLAIIYLLYGLFVIIVAVKKEKFIDKPDIVQYFSGSSFVWTSFGVLLMAAVFLSYTLSRVSVIEIARSVPYILFGDPDHPAKKLWKIIPGYFARIAVGNDRNYLTLGVYFLLGVELLIIFVDKNREKHINKYVNTAAILTILLQVIYFISDGYINHMMLAPNALALFLVILLSDKPAQKIFFCIWFPGMIYTFLEYISSNTGFSGISSAASVAAVGGVMIVCLSSGHIYQTNKIGSLLMGIMIAITILTVLYFRVTYIFWEDGIEEQTELITKGPQAGLLVSEEKYKYYYGILSDVEDIINMDEEINVLYVCDKSLYLTGHSRCASYSPLCYGISSSRDLLYEYYDLHPDKVPDIVYIESSYGNEVVEELCKELHMNSLKKDFGYLLYRD